MSTDNVLTLTIPGEPMGKQRPRMMKTGHTYTPAKTVNYEVLIRQLFIEEFFGHKPFESAVKIKIDAYFAIPKSASKRKKSAMMAGNIRPMKKPDCDNIAKIICDALNSLAYLDDKQIIDCTISKFYSDIPRVDVVIEGEVDA